MEREGECHLRFAPLRLKDSNSGGLFKFLVEVRTTTETTNKDDVLRESIGQRVTSWSFGVFSHLPACRTLLGWPVSDDLQALRSCRQWE